MTQYDGFLIPPWYESKPLSHNAERITCTVWGFSLGIAVFTCAKALRQSWRSYQRRKLFNAYILMIWAELVSSVLLSIFSFLLMQEILPPSFWTFFAVLIVWIIQLECILQIVANRLGFLISDPKHVWRLKLAIFVIVTLIAVSVSCTWIPARLQISEEFVRINHLWDRLTRAIFAAVDLALNLSFLYLVWRRLISGGLKKYWVLFWMNTAMICVSISLDVLLIVIMSLRSPKVYIQFSPLVFLAKLYIELNLAELISRIVRSSNPLNGVDATTRDADLATAITPDHHHHHHHLEYRRESIPPVDLEAGPAGKVVVTRHIEFDVSPAADASSSELQQTLKPER